MQLSDEERQRRADRMRQMHAVRAAAVERLPPAPDETRRFNVVDFQQHGPWIMKRLMERYPHLNDRMFNGWLRVAMESPEFLFVRTDKCIGLAQIVRHPLQPKPDAEEVFCFVIDGNEAEDGKPFYAALKRWTEACGVGWTTVEVQTDVPRAMIAEVMGRVIKYETSVVRTTAK